MYLVALARPRTTRFAGQLSLSVDRVLVGWRASGPRSPGRAANVQLVLAGLELLDALGAAAPARVVRRKLQALGVRSVPRGPRPTTRARPCGCA